MLFLMLSLMVALLFAAIVAIFLSRISCSRSPVPDASCMASPYLPSLSGASGNTAYMALPPIPPLPKISIGPSSFNAMLHTSILPSQPGMNVENRFQFTSNGNVEVHSKDDSLNITFREDNGFGSTALVIETKKDNLTKLIYDLANVVDRDQVTPALADALDNLKIISRLSQ